MSLELENIQGGYCRKIVLENISLKVVEHKITTLLGPNGCGKSTLLKIIGRLLKAEGGTIYLDGKSICSYSANALAKKMAVLPQFHQSFHEITVGELVAYGRYPHQKIHQLALSDYDKYVINNALSMTRLNGLESRLISSLSGGERQRAWIAMTLAQEPEILLLDEPTTFLDICCQFEILEMIKNLNHKSGLTVLMVLHDLNLASRYSDILVTIKNHRICHVGTPAEIVNPAIIKEVFQIESEVIFDKTQKPYFIPVSSVRLAEDI